MGEEIVKATVKDIQAILALVNSAYRGDTSRQGWTTEADFLDGQRVDEAWLFDIIQNPGACILLYKLDNTICACVELGHLENQQVLLGMLSVNPKMQSQGIGSKLIEAAESFARSKFGATRMVLKVISIRRELIAYYQRKSYEQKDEYEAFPYGDSRFGLPKRDDLQFVRMEKYFDFIP